MNPPSPKPQAPSAEREALLMFAPLAGTIERRIVTFSREDIEFTPRCILAHGTTRNSLLRSFRIGVEEQLEVTPIPILSIESNPEHAIERLESAIDFAREFFALVKAGQESWHWKNAGHTPAYSTLTRGERITLDIEGPCSRVWLWGRTTA